MAGGTADCDLQVRGKHDAAAEPRSGQGAGNCRPRLQQVAHRTRGVLECAYRRTRAACNFKSPHHTQILQLLAFTAGNVLCPSDVLSMNLRAGLDDRIPREGYTGVQSDSVWPHG